MILSTGSICHGGVELGAINGVGGVFGDKTGRNALQTAGLGSTTDRNYPRNIAPTGKVHHIAINGGSCVGGSTLGGITVGGNIAGI